MNKTKTAEAAYALFDEFRAAYAAEWERLARCERLYHGDHWEGVPEKDAAGNAGAAFHGGERAGRPDG